MDTSNIRNYTLIEEIKIEASKLNIFEAFLESAPQVIAQTYAIFGLRINTEPYSHPFRGQFYFLNFFLTPVSK